MINCTKKKEVNVYQNRKRKLERQLENILKCLHFLNLIQIHETLKSSNLHLRVNNLKIILMKLTIVTRLSGTLHNM